MVPRTTHKTTFSQSRRFDRAKPDVFPAVLSLGGRKARKVYAPSQHRALSALSALVIVACGSLALMLGLSFASPSTAPRSALEAILPTHSMPAPHSQKLHPSPSRSSAPRGRPAATARAVHLEAPARPPPPPVALPLKPATTIAGNSATPDQGAAQANGSGQGAGGVGAGSGGGGIGGDGTGSGAGPGDYSAYPRQTAGELHYSDIPEQLRRNHTGTIRLRYRIGPDGRVSDCTVLQSSGLPDFDRQTCANITARFRFRPALDIQGRPVPFIMNEIHGWDHAPVG